MQNAASIAALFLATEVAIADKPEENPASAGDPTGACAAWTSDLQAPG